MQVSVTNVLFAGMPPAAVPIGTGMGSVASPIETSSLGQSTESSSASTPSLSRRNFLRAGLFGGLSLAVGGCLAGAEKEAIHGKPPVQDESEIRQNADLGNRLTSPDRESLGGYEEHTQERSPVSLVAGGLIIGGLMRVFGNVTTRRKFFTWYKERTQEHPYISAAVTGMIVGGWMRVFGDAIIRSNDKNYDTKKWIWFHLVSTILYDMEKVPVYKLLDRFFPTYHPSSEGGKEIDFVGSSVGKFLKTCAISVLYGIPWTWRHLFFMDWVDKGKAPLSEAFSGKYLKDTIKTWLPGEAYLFPTDYFIQNYLPPELRVFGVMVLQRLPMQVWYTYRQLAIKKGGS